MSLSIMWLLGKAVISIGPYKDFYKTDGRYKCLKLKSFQFPLVFFFFFHGILHEGNLFRKLPFVSV